MLTWDKEQLIGGRKNADDSVRIYKEGTCLSTDTKPTNVDNGSKLIEMDTSKLYVFDLDGNQWREW